MATERTSGKISRSRYWTHPSVQILSDVDDPVSGIADKARLLVYDAIQKGWSGPPFDPFDLARILGIRVVPRDDVVDAQIVPSGGMGLVIQFNPNSARARVRHSLALELAHTLFPDCKDRVRNRLARKNMRDDDWQIEMLCNIAAAEFLMPIGSFPDLRGQILDFDILLELRRKYNVSTEALFLRAIRLTDTPCCFFAACQHDGYGTTKKYRIDYAVSSCSQTLCLPSGVVLPNGSHVEKCTTIGISAKGDEVWPTLGSIQIECVGIAPYPRHVFPRVAGLITSHKKDQFSGKSIRYLKGDATAPRGSKPIIIAFIVNDKGLSWGAGFALAVRRKWPSVQRHFTTWSASGAPEYSLGGVHSSEIEDGLMAFEMVAQHGYGPSPRPRIRYGALEDCLHKLAADAKRRGASVHMPRIGTGEAGGSWAIVEEMIERALCRHDIDVTVYDLSGTK